MNQLKRYEDLPFQKKLFFVFGFSLVFCIVVAVFVLTDYCTRILVRNNIDNLTVISQQAGIDFNRRVSDTEKQLFNNITMFQIPDSIAACDADKSDYKKRELKYRLNQIVAENTYFDYACLVTDGGYTCDTIEKIGKNKGEIRTFSQDALENYKKNTMKNGYVWISDEDNRIYLMHSVRQRSTLKHEGYLIVRIKDRAFKLAEVLSQGIGLVFYDRDQNCVHVETNSEELADKIREDGLENGYQKIAGQSYYIVENSIKNSEWSVIGITPISSIYHMRLKVQIVAAVLTVVTLICGCILMQYLTRKVSRQINALSDTIQNATKGEIGIQAPVYMNDDIGKIARRFNEMSLQNKKLIEELVQAEAQKNSAKMEAVDYKYRFLHTQINPHFIYNSLETINAIAKVNHTPEVSRIVQLIGKYFRNITKYSDHQFIALEKEFELLQCFIDIYKNIRGSNIEIRLDYPQELKSVEIPTMLLQPIVENSFVHGMRGMDELFIVCLSAKGIRDEQGKLSEMILSVEDNGIGMDEEAVERLTKGKRTEPDEKDRKKVFRNIGVPNIIERLKMLYGDRAKLTVTSGENGTTIQIRLPADGEKKEII